MCHEVFDLSKTKMSFLSKLLRLSYKELHPRDPKTHPVNRRYQGHCHNHYVDNNPGVFVEVGGDLRGTPPTLVD